MRWWRVAVRGHRRRLRWIWGRVLGIVHRRLRIHRWVRVLLPRAGLVGLVLVGMGERRCVVAGFLAVVAALGCHGVQPSATAVPAASGRDTAPPPGRAFALVATRRWSVTLAAD